METNQNAVSAVTAPEAVVSPTLNPLSAATIPTTLGGPSSGTTPSVLPPAPPEVGGNHGTVAGTTTITNPVVGGTPTPQGSALSSAEANGLIQEVLGLGSNLAPYVVVLQAANLRSVNRPRIGLEPQVPVLVGLATKYGLSWDGYPLDRFATEVETVQSLQQVLQPLTALCKQLSDTILVKRSGYQTVMLGLYGQLEALSGNKPGLAEALLPIEKVLAPSKGKKRVPKASTTGASSSSASAPTATGAVVAGAATANEAMKPLVERRRFVRSALHR